MISHANGLVRNMLAVLFIAGMLVASAWILSPFLPALIWSTLLVVSTWSVMLKVQAKLWGKRGLAATVMTLALLLVVIVPLAAAMTTIIENADELAARAQTLKGWTVPPPPAWAEHLPIVGTRLTQKWQAFSALGPEELRAQLDPYGRDITHWVLQTAGSLAVFFLHLTLTLILAAVLYAKGEVAADGLRAFARRLAGDQGLRAVSASGEAVRAVALGVVVAALVQSLAGGIGLAVVGVPFAALLTAVMFILGVAQIGAGPVLILSIIWVYWKDDTTTATLFLLWCLFVGSIDNVVRPILVKMGADLPLLLIFAGVIGGLLGFGVAGLFIGPVVLAVVYTLFKGWVDERPADETHAG